MSNTLKLDMNKATAGLRLSLQKLGINVPPEMELAFNLDVSGSFDDEHRGGLTQGLLTRLVPWGMVFDPDKKMDVFTFSSGPEYAHYVGEITAESYEGYIEKRIIGKVPGYGQGTDYVHVLRKNLQHFGYGNQPAVVAAKPQGGGMFSRLFSGSKPAIQNAVQPAATPAKKRALVIHVTDGDNNNGDKEPTRRLLRESADRGDLVYFLFIGCSNQPGEFSYIEALGDEFPNVGLAKISDIGRFVAMSDDEVNGQLIGDELVEWLKK